ncbi:hypothetical protein [Streptomyces sp. 2314.4]|uniref:hypothetical protein n=1 Tax=Streptomyces sp. 2314.4 TaxID=1881025 RepID=UPI00115FBF0E|nr:hypothetical protein [Streptomyces sp. 2314.4]
MSSTELERLARIRMQVTGETLERAMAVLEGHAATPEPNSEPDAATEDTGNSEVNEADAPNEASDGSDGSDGSENAPRRDEGRTPKRRGHLRSL